MPRIMSDELEKLCDKCRERLATFHSTMCSGGETQTSDLCMTCWEQSATPEELASQRRFQEAVATGKCKYCGDPAVSGSFSGGLVTMEEQVDLWCESCRADFVEFMSRPENVMPDEFPVGEAAAAHHHQRLTAVMTAADEYVKRRATKRKSTG